MYRKLPSADTFLFIGVCLHLSRYRVSTSISDSLFVHIPDPWLWNADGFAWGREGEVISQSLKLSEADAVLSWHLVPQGISLSCQYLSCADPNRFAANEAGVLGSHLCAPASCTRIEQAFPSFARYSAVRRVAGTSRHRPPKSSSAQTKLNRLRPHTTQDQRW